jgi:hypothetical protein
MWPPPLLASRPPLARALAVVLGPLITGVVGGWLLGQTKAGYLIWTLVMILGGIGAGMEHETSRGGALRGLVAGVLFAGAILVTHELIGNAALAELPDPPVLLCAVFGAISAILGLVGAALRRHITRAATA